LLQAGTRRFLKTREKAPQSFDVQDQYAYVNVAEVQHYADIQVQCREAIAKQWRGRSTVRIMAGGIRFALTQGPLSTDSAPVYVLLRLRIVVPATCHHRCNRRWSRYSARFRVTGRSGRRCLRRLRPDHRPFAQSGYADSF
jgi:uncharacterized protein involved in type VI secretion and phage assembly